MFSQAKTGSNCDHIRPVTRGLASKQQRSRQAAPGPRSDKSGRAERVGHRLLALEGLDCTPISELAAMLGPLLWEARMGGGQPWLLPKTGVETKALGWDHFSLPSRKGWAQWCQVPFPAPKSHGTRNLLGRFPLKRSPQAHLTLAPGLAGVIISGQGPLSSSDKPPASSALSSGLLMRANRAQSQAVAGVPPALAWTAHLLPGSPLAVHQSTQYLLSEAHRARFGTVRLAATATLSRLPETSTGHLQRLNRVSIV
ncbi:hypothetical protein CB1_000098002 [Camelus ferus]|nr:hypothetical protein CB1_000098002 [Camelus ferus]